MSPIENQESPMNEPKPIFISFKTAESLPEARVLANKLASVGVQSFLSQDDLQKGVDWRIDIARALDACTIFIALGSETYGSVGTSSQGTWEELIFAKDKGKFLYVIKMCTKFKEPHELSKLQMPSVSPNLLL